MDIKILERIVICNVAHCNPSNHYLVSDPNFYFCYKETRRGNVTKGKNEKEKLCDHKNQEARLPKQNKKWTEGRKIKNKPESYHFEYIRNPMNLRTKLKSYTFE